MALYIYGLKNHLKNLISTNLKVNKIMQIRFLRLLNLFAWQLFQLFNHTWRLQTRNNWICRNEVCAWFSQVHSNSCISTYGSGVSGIFTLESKVHLGGTSCAFGKSITAATSCTLYIWSASLAPREQTTFCGAVKNLLGAADQQRPLNQLARERTHNMYNARWFSRESVLFVWSIERVQTRRGRGRRRNCCVPRNRRVIRKKGTRREVSVGFGFGFACRRAAQMDLTE